jgi:DNA-directed RNA polymerase specialized sigma24 family protein
LASVWQAATNDCIHNKGDVGDVGDAVFRKASTGARAWRSSENSPSYVTHVTHGGAGVISRDDFNRAVSIVCDERQRYILHQANEGVSYRQIARDLEVDHSTILRARDRAFLLIRRYLEHEKGTAA